MWGKKARSGRDVVFVLLGPVDTKAEVTEIVAPYAHHAYALRTFVRLPQSNRMLRVMKSDEDSESESGSDTTTTEETAANPKPE